MTIDIHINAQSAVEARAQMRALLGFDEAAMREYSEPKTTARTFGSGDSLADRIEAAEDEPTTADQSAPAPAEAEPAKRKRRTKAEIEADKAAEAAAARPEQAEEAPSNISTGEERIDPANPEDVAQDAADEAAEAEKAKAAAGGKLTHDDVRGALKGYVAKFGMPAAMDDGPKVIALVCGDGKVKVSDVPDDQEVLAKVIAGINEMIAKNPYKREAV